MGRLFRLIFSIVVVVCSSLHALSGAAQGALLDLKNPAQSALWGAIGAAGAEVAMEAVYDPVARSKALIKDINQRVAQGELPQMLADVGVELPQPSKEIGRETSQRQGVVTRSQSRSLNAEQRQAQVQREQVVAGLTQVFTKELRADVERTRDLVRAGLSLGALASGVQSEQMSMMDGTASQALTHNFAPAVIPVGMAALEAALPGLLASAAGALGITYAWDALTDLFSGNTEQQLPFGNEDEKLRSKGTGRAQEVGQSTAAGCMMPEDPDHEPHDEEPRKSKPAKVNKQKPKQPGDLYNKNNKEEFIRQMREHEKNLGARKGKPKDATTLRAAEIEATGEQIEIAKQRETTYNHGRKVESAQEGLINLGEKLEKEMRHIDNLLKHRSKHPQIPEMKRYRIWLERFRDNVRNKFEITHKRVPFVPQEKR